MAKVFYGESFTYVTGETVEEVISEYSELAGREIYNKCFSSDKDRRALEVLVDDEPLSVLRYGSLTRVGAETVIKLDPKPNH